MDRLTRALYATSAAAVLSFMAVITVMLVVSAPGFRVTDDRAGVAPAPVMVGDFYPTIQAG